MHVHCRTDKKTVMERLGPKARTRTPTPVNDRLGDKKMPVELRLGGKRRLKSGSGSVSSLNSSFDSPPKRPRRPRDGDGALTLMEFSSEYDIAKMEARAVKYEEDLHRFKARAEEFGEVTAPVLVYTEEAKRKNLRLKKYKEERDNEILGLGEVTKQLGKL